MQIVIILKGQVAMVIKLIGVSNLQLLTDHQLYLLTSHHSGKMKWKGPSSAFIGVLLNGLLPSSANCTKLYSPLIRATTLVLSSIGRTLNGAVLVYSKLSPGFRTGCRPVTPGP
jgi:hypothetical protein